MKARDLCIRGIILFTVIGLSFSVNAEETQLQISREKNASTTANSESEADADFAKAISADQAEPPSASVQVSAMPNSVQKVQMNPDISLILDTGFGWFSDENHITQGGHAIDDNGFALQGLEFAASANVDPYFRFDLNFELSHLHLEEAYLTTLSMPWNLQMRAGYLNAQIGRENPQHLHTWNFVNPSLAHTRFMSEEHFSSAGAELSALMPFPWYFTLIGQVLDTKTALRSSTFSDASLTDSGKLDGPEDFVYVSRAENFFELSPNWSLLLGANGAWGQSPYVADNRATIYGGDIYIKYRPIMSGNDAFAMALTLEYLMRDTQVPGDFVRDHGGYAEFDIQFTRYWMAGLRGDYCDLLRDADTRPEQIGEMEYRGSASLTWMPTHFSKVRLQYDLGDNNVLDQVYHAVFVQLEVSAGEHGAHKF